MATVYFGIFEWDSEKNARNKRKHGVAFEDAVVVFDDPREITRHDESHSEDEQRWLTLGRAAGVCILAVISVDRHGSIRLISARRATRTEVDEYESE